MSTIKVEESVTSSAPTAPTSVHVAVPKPLTVSTVPSPVLPVSSSTPPPLHTQTAVPVPIPVTVKNPIPMTTTTVPVPVPAPAKIVMAAAPPAPIPAPSTVITSTTTPTGVPNPTATAVPAPASVTVARRPVTAPVPAPVPATVVTSTAVPAAPEQPATTGRATTKSKKKKSQPVVTMATAATAQSNSQGSQGENTGRWTAEEHRLFLQGLELHGKGWKKIASLIKSRTVVQIRTHAQKYFQKLAKARQNGEEGEVAMEGRGGTASVAAVSTTAAAQNNKRRRQTTGTKRKVIQSVVASAQRQNKKLAAAAATAGQAPPTPIPTASPALAHFLLPSAPSPTPTATTTATTTTITSTTSTTHQSCVPSITTAQGTISGPALEDSLFRFLTPAPVAPETQVNEVARQAGANPITVPSESPSTAPSSFGETSPTGVADLAIYPSWTDAKDTPTWYTKGADVDALLDVGDTLDWLADTGDLHETYQPPPPPSEVTHHEVNHVVTHAVTHIPVAEEVDKHDGNLSSSATNNSVTSLPCVETNVESVVPPLPSIFEGSGGEHPESTVPPKDLSLVTSAPQLHRSASTNSIDEHLQVFDTPMEEHDFVSTILENATESTESLPVLQ